MDNSNSTSIISADINQDAKKDLLVLQSAFIGESFVSTLISLGGDGFSAPKAIVRGGTVLAAADLNNDGYKDLITGEETNFLARSEILVALNDKAGGLLSSTRFQTPDYLETIKDGDFNGDGNKDIISAHSYNPRGIAVHLGNGTGGLGTPVVMTFTAGIMNLIAGDYNADGKDDVFAIDENGRGFTLLSNGNGTFIADPIFSITFQFSLARIAKADFNEDGKLDLVISDGGSTNLWLGDGTGKFTKSTNPIPSFGDVAIGDYNGDGNLDLAGLADGKIKAALGNGNGEFSESSPQPITGL